MLLRMYILKGPMVKRSLVRGWRVEGWGGVRVLFPAGMDRGEAGEGRSMFRRRMGRCRMLSMCMMYERH